jgi:hypothetical protein
VMLGAVAAAVDGAWSDRVRPPGSAHMRGVNCRPRPVES